MHRIKIIDTHTAGDPTRLVLSGGPDLGPGPLLARRARFKSVADHLRRALVGEPRGHAAMTGVLLCEPHHPSCSIGAIFFDASGFLDISGHAAMGLLKALAHRGDIAPGAHRIDTPGGVIRAELHENGTTTIFVEGSYRERKEVTASVPGLGAVTGDIVWSGWWRFVTSNYPGPIVLPRVNQLSVDAAAILRSLAEAGVTGPGGQAIEHVGFFAPAESPACDAGNFEYRAGFGYRRSPSVSGVAAKIACLAADAQLAEGQSWRALGIAGGVFEASYSREGDKITTQVRGAAFVSAEMEFVLDPTDPFCWGFAV